MIYSKVWHSTSNVKGSIAAGLAKLMCTNRWNVWCEPVGKVPECVTCSLVDCCQVLCHTEPRKIALTCSATNAYFLAGSELKADTIQGVWQALAIAQRHPAELQMALLWPILMTKASLLSCTNQHVWCSWCSWAGIPVILYY